MLTKILNQPIDETLGIKEKAENSDVPSCKDIYEKYEFELPKSELPIASKQKDILQAIKSRDVTIIRAATGAFRIFEFFF